jgi:ComF family protein
VTELRCGLRVVALDGYEGALATVVKKLKYQGRTDLARPLGRRLADAVRATRPILPDGVVSVPLHPKRLAERGYNQSALVARELARALCLPFSPWALARRRSTSQQASLDKREREKNVAGAFEVRARLPAARILLVDDVVTTGATAVEAAAALLLSGATEVSVASVLRADRNVLR